MKRFLCAALLVVCSCSRSNLQAIDRMATADASDTRQASDTRPPSDTSPASDAANEARPADASDTRPAVSCPSSLPQFGDSEQTLMMGTTKRSYWLHIPTSYDGTQPAPLIFDFHANGGNGLSQSKSSPYPDKTDSEGVVMAFPSGLTGPWGAAWNLGPCCVADVDDVEFTKDMIDQIQRSVCIDKKRIYAVGNITGGGMAYTLACRAAETFAAVAASAWDLLKENVADCKPARPITVVSFRGTGDKLVPYDGAYSTLVPGMPITFLGAQKTFQKWAEIDQCMGSPSPSDANGCSRYSNCQGGVEVVLCSKQGGASDVSDPSIAWPLLKKHSLP